MNNSRALLNHRTVFFVVLFAGYFFLRWWHIETAIGLGSDAGRDFLTVWNLYMHHKFTLIGPPSEFTVFGHEFYFGPLPFYEILPALIIGKGSIVFVSYYLTLVNAAGFFIALWIMYKYIPDKMILYIFGLLLTVSPTLIEYTRSYWNPYPMIVISTLLLSIFVRLQYENKSLHTRLVFFIIGILFGLGLQSHYSYVLTISLSAIILWVMNRVTKQTVAYMLLGFIVGFSPVILFELRNHFYILSTFVLTIQQGTSLTFHSSLPQFYFISLIPFSLYSVSYLCVFFWKKRVGRYVVSIGLILYTIQSLATTLPVHTHGQGMAEGWNVVELEKTAAFILSQHPTQYNIVDQLTGDNRAMSLRYILTVDALPPMNIDQYPFAKTLFVYTRLSAQEIVHSNLWEIHSAQPMRLVKTWTIQNGIRLYQLQKI